METNARIYNKGWRKASLLAIACCFASGLAFGQQSQPNIIFIVADDMGYGDSLAHNPASKIALPNIKRIADEGVTFTRAYTATPKCAPSRYSFLTGNYQWRGFKSWGWWQYAGGSQVLDSQQTIANVLTEDYVTSIIGKYHLGGNFYLKNSNTYASHLDDENLLDFDRPMEDGARARGFDYSYILLRGIQSSPYAYFENDLITSPSEQLINWPVGWYNEDYSRIVSEGIGAPDFDTSLVGTQLAQATLTHLNQVVSSQTTEPFFLYLPAIAAHHPTTPPDFFYGMAIRNTQYSLRADILHELDKTLGLILDFLDNNGLADDTLIIVTSDNGGGASQRQRDIDNYSHDVNAGLRGGKGDIWDGGVRIPLIMRWGDGTPAGSTLPLGAVSDKLIALQDIPVTLSALTGKTSEYDQMKDSYNMLAELFDPGSSGVLRESLILESRDEQGVPAAPRFAIVENEWKLVLDGNDQPAALFDMKLDRNETINLLTSGQHTEVAERLREKLLTLRAADRTAPVPDLIPQNLTPTGQPVLTDEDEGLFIWGNSGDASLELAAKSAAGSAKTTEVVVEADQSFEWVQANSLESRDTLEWDGEKRVVFTSYSTGSTDGFTAKLPKGATAVAKLSDSSEIQEIKYGSMKYPRGTQLILNNRRGFTEAIQPGMNAELIKGKPLLANADQGVFLWSEANDGQFEVAVKGALGETLTAELEIIADRDFELVEGVSLEAADTLEWLGNNRIRLTSDANGEADGFRAKLPLGSTFLTVITTNIESELAYGPDKAVSSPNAWQLALNELSHNGSAESGRLLANVSVSASSGTPDQVELRWRGDGSGTAFLVDLFFNQTVAQATPFNANTPYQDVSFSQNSVSASAFLMNEVGGVDVQVPGASEVGIYFHDANGQIPDYLLNLPGGLGAPNAHRVKLAEPIPLPPGC